MLTLIRMPDLEHLLEQDVVRIDDEFRISIYMPVDLLVRHEIDVRNYVIDVDNPTVEDCALIQMLHPNETGDHFGLELFGYKIMSNAYDEPSSGYL